MFVRAFKLGIVTAGTMLALVSCSGGSTTKSSSPACVGSSKFCLIECNLGCTVTGTCAVSEIAQNQPIVLRFSDRVDAGSVGPGTIAIRTLSGETPSGRFFVDGNQIVFVPEVRLAGGTISFGFRSNEVYQLSLPGGVSSGTLRSASGHPLSTAVSCSLSVSQGIIDGDGQRPRALLITPMNNERNVPRDTTIVVRLSELIDISPFQGGSTSTSPIQYRARRTKIENGAVVCDPNQAPIEIGGVPQASINATTPVTTDITLQPANLLPKDLCVEVAVTAALRDLSGKPAEPITFQFFVESGQIVRQTITETFSTAAHFDPANSGGTWSGGVGTPTILGGSGRLGPFDYRTGSPDPNQAGVFVISTDSYTVPATHALFGQEITVTNGVFEFQRMNIPVGVTVAFRGSRPAVVKVRGQVVIEGSLTANGQTLLPFVGAAVGAGPGAWVAINGQVGGIAGASGGAGGRGATGIAGTVLAATELTAAQLASPGLPPSPPMSSGYFNHPMLAGTVGPAGAHFPGFADPQLNGPTLNGRVSWNLFLGITGMIGGAGSGGSLIGAGTAGRPLTTFTSIAADLGPVSGTGMAIPFVAPNGRRSIDHFLVGGAGGGGGAASVVNIFRANLLPTSGTPQPWHAGSAGGGGGGAFGLRIGGTCEVRTGGKLAARGADGGRDASTGAPGAPGGGGSGGTVLIQIDNVTNFSNGGEIDVRGGTGQTVSSLGLNQMTATNRGGSGGVGFVRLESVQGTPTAANLGTVLGPPAIGANNLGTIPATDGDDFVGFQSTWYTTGQLIPPTFNHYSLVVRDAATQQITTFSDQPGGTPADGGGAFGVQIWFQGARVDASDPQVLLGEPGPWRPYVANSRVISINTDSATGFRFMVVFDRTVNPNLVVTDMQVEIQY